MPLSKEQKQLLDKLAISADLQWLFASELGENGRPRNSNEADFLQILSNHLFVAETTLQIERGKLAKLKAKSGLNPKPEAQSLIDVWEQEIKTKWDVATAIWRACDIVIVEPERYGVNLDPKHVHYMLLTKNLPVIEMIKLKRPEYFELMPGSKILQMLNWMFGFIGGFWAGLVGGFLGGIQKAKKLKSWTKPFWMIVYAFKGLFIGCFTGFMLGANFGYQTASLPTALKLAYFGAYIDPFREPRGSKDYQLVELKKVTILFELSQRRTLIRRNKEQSNTAQKNIIKRDYAQSDHRTNTR